ncbi:MAG: hypothetical protein ABSF58_00050 [Solirubrobacteraceae bacterium]
MHVFLDIGSGEGPRLIDATDFEAFKVVIAGGHDVESARHALTPVAELLDEGDAMVDAGELTLLAGELAESAEWIERFAGMLDYARSKGWVSESAAATRIQAHVEWSDAAAES